VNDHPDLGYMSDLWFRVGEASAPPCLIFEPLFEEANRCRRLIAGIMRGLADAGLCAVLPVLPGFGESERAIADVLPSDWVAASGALIAAIQPVMIVSLRGGAMLDGGGRAAPVWRLSPEPGARIVRDLKRSTLTSSASDERLYAGHALSEVFLDQLAAMPLPSGGAVRTVRLENDAGEADRHVLGQPLWRRAEPGDDADLAALLAQDIVAWSRSCAS
jgi:hypothetical protein